MANQTTMDPLEPNDEHFDLVESKRGSIPELSRYSDYEVAFMLKNSERAKEYPGTLIKHHFGRGGMEAYQKVADSS